MYVIANSTPIRQHRAVCGDRLEDIDAPRRELYDEVLLPLRAILRNIAREAAEPWGAFSPVLLEVYLADLLIEGLAHLRNAMAGEAEIDHLRAGVAAVIGLDVENYQHEVQEASAFAQARWLADARGLCVSVRTSPWPFVVRPGGGLA